MQRCTFNTPAGFHYPVDPGGQVVGDAADAAAAAAAAAGVVAAAAAAAATAAEAAAAAAAGVEVHSGRCLNLVADVTEAVMCISKLENSWLIVRINKQNKN